ncbi:VCL [Lepeophtheirus salmonis]|uniref:Vinculin n=1 Tax=Lepeophtheirus salmonis TaxID=72036 RepID=A0A7R8H6I5_LEPSM|nr:VCL [Lepeophtheirus salmonis]CAF2900113.1 VCL [Lepeophtheirus salmonis]
MFRTVALGQILEPVVLQVSRLVIIHEEGEAGHEMPDLVRPVQAVSKAVHNLVKVGREMVISSDDAILKQDMPQALSKVENAAHLLEDAASISQLDPLSKLARSKLIEGSRLILQGTSNVLMVFDESEVRKIVRECKKVLDYLSVAEVIESMEDLVQFVKDLSPCLSKVTFDVEKRIEDLTHQVHRECLSKCVEQVKTLAPILICSMKIFIQILVNGGKGTDEAGENRNYLAGRMSEEVSEIVRVLQLTTYDEDEWDSDNLTVMRKTQAAIESKIQNSRDWIRDPSSSGGGSSSSSLGEKSSKLILELANKIADRSLPGDAEHIRKLSGDIRSMTDSLSELRTSGEGGTLQAEILARNIDSRLNELSTTISQAINRVEKSGIQQPAPTISGKLEQARRWLEQPGVDDRGLGQHAINLILDEARKIAELLPPNQRDSVRSLCIETEDDIRDLKDLCTSGYAGSSRAQNLARQIATRLDAIKDAILSVLVERVVKDFMDVGYPLKKLTDCVQNPVGASLDRDRIFIEKSDKLSLSSDNIGRTAKMVALGNDSGNKKLAEGLLAAASQVESLTPQLINAGRICMVYPENAAAKEHFENLRKQYIETNDRARALCDDAVDSRDFVAKSLSAMEADARRCETCVRDSNSLGLVEEAMNIARLANRVFQVAHQEAENSEEPAFISTLNISAEKLQSRLQIMLQSAKALALNLTNESAIKDWRKQSQALLESVKGVQGAISYSDSHSLPTYPNMSGLHIKGGEARDSFVTPSYPQRAPPVLTSPFRDQKRAHLEKKQPDFTDEELSDIFQINFNEIFGSPDAAIAQSSPYKGITLPDKGRARNSKEFESIPSPPTQFDDNYQLLNDETDSKRIKASILEKANRPVVPKSESADKLIEKFIRETEFDKTQKELSKLPPPAPPPLPSFKSNPKKALGPSERKNHFLFLILTQNRETPPCRPPIIDRALSDDNFHGELTHEITREHHSVKDLVKMIEKNTKSENARKKDYSRAAPSPSNETPQGRAASIKKIYNWRNDDYFKHKHRNIMEGDGDDECLMEQATVVDDPRVKLELDLMSMFPSTRKNVEVPDIIVSHDKDLSLPPPPSPPSLAQMDMEISSLQNQFEMDLNTLLSDSKKRSTLKSKGRQQDDRNNLLRVDGNNNQHTTTLSDDEGTYAALSVVFQDTSQSESDPNAPPRPPLPSDDDYYNGHHLNGTQNRPVNFDTTDDESEDFFLSAPTPSQGPIMLAAHDLHQEVRQWSSKDNDIIAAAKKMAHLMAKLSQLVGEDSGSKRELITCAKSIAEASDDVTRIAKELAKECTDKRMRTNLLQVCERIPTIATQLKILSTVKATMLGVQSNRGTCEDMEATEMLVGNAQNLMQSVKHTVTVAEAASIKIRTDAGIRLKWVRKQPGINTNEYNFSHIPHHTIII